MSTSRVLRIYHATRARRTRLLMWTAAVFDGLWLGVLRPKDLDALDDAFYRATTETLAGEEFGYAEAAYTERGLDPWEASFVEGLAPGSRVLVTGAGGGREVLALLRAGHDAVGYEPNAAFVEGGASTLAAHGHADRLQPMPRHGFPDVAGPWDAVLVGWGSYMSVPGRAARVGFLRAARERLVPGGALLVSAWHREVHTDYDKTAARVGTAVRRLARRPPLDVGDALVDCFVHVFTREEIEGEVREAGLEPLRFGSEPCAWVVARSPA